MHSANNTEQNRLAWQCRRGMRELDVLLGGYLASGYESLSNTDKVQFNRLLEYPDTVLLELLMGRMAPTDTDVAHLVQHIRSSLAS